MDTSNKQGFWPASVAPACESNHNTGLPLKAEFHFS
jgi:hypothetical protein